MTGPVDFIKQIITPRLMPAVVGMTGGTVEVVEFAVKVSEGGVVWAARAHGAWRSTVPACARATATRGLVTT